MATPAIKLRLNEIRTDIDSMRSDIDALWRDTRYAQSLMEKVKEDLYLIYPTISTGFDINLEKVAVCDIVKI